jgi:hypothetical protein
MWTIAKYNPVRENLSLFVNGQVWARHMTAVAHFNRLSAVTQAKCRIVEVPDWARNNPHALVAFLHEDEETRKEILTDWKETT